MPRLHSPPHTIAVYASQWSSPSTTQHSLPGGCYALPEPDLHRLEHASFCLAHGQLTYCSKSQLLVLGIAAAFGPGPTDGKRDGPDTLGRLPFCDTPNVNEGSKCHFPLPLPSVTFLCALFVSCAYRCPRTLTPCQQRPWVWWFRELRNPHQLRKQPLQPIRERIVFRKNPRMHRRRLDDCAARCDQPLETFSLRELGDRTGCLVARAGPSLNRTRLPMSRWR